MTQLVEVEPGNIVWMSLSAIMKKEQHVIVPTTFTFFHPEWHTYSHKTVQTIWQGWKKWGFISTRDTVVHKLLEKHRQNISIEDHL